MKDELRKQMRGLLSAQPDVERRDRSMRIAENLFSLEEYKRAEELAIYVSFGYEVHTHGIIAAAILSGKRVFVPSVEEKRECISLHEVTSLGDLVPGYMGIPEPKICKQPHPPSKVCLAIVPGLAFDARGRRLGRGKGMFDRLLRKMKCPKVGLAFGFQVIGSVPRHSHDVPVDILVTEEQVMHILREREGFKPKKTSK